MVESKPPEIGVLDITMTPAAKDDPLFGQYPQTIKAVTRDREAPDIAEGATAYISWSPESTIALPL